MGEAEFDQLVADSWLHDGVANRNAMVTLKDKLKQLKLRILDWVKNKRRTGKSDLKEALKELDEKLDAGEVGVIETRDTLLKSLIELEKGEAVDLAQKAKV